MINFNPKILLLGRTQHVIQGPKLLLSQRSGYIIINAVRSCHAMHSNTGTVCLNTINVSQKYLENNILKN